ncbi:MAG: hypothetical protein GWN01_14230, partial [Nitrosopumilaceae archaeon]|nr:hypothetical protein [Nitrosopumilaceae archaeon]NIU88400.1 hypothetical protein [Nitrosopumilaceae archaeon]NIX62615.1 hypothetical protein [Nitrosopumilaceae archaeon]
ATLFHAGKVLKIFPSNSSIEVVIDGLSKPHGGMLYPNGYLVTSTGSGAVYCKGENELNIYDFSTLPSKPVALKNLEWLQFSNCLDDIVLSVDSNRHALVCV